MLKTALNDNNGFDKKVQGLESEVKKFCLSELRLYIIGYTVLLRNTFST